MLKKNNFFKHYFIQSTEYKKNLKKTKKVFSTFLLDLRNNQIPLLDSYEKNYEFDFSKKTVRQFSKYKNIIIIGMGGSILGTKSIYSFLGKKIKKKLFFFDNLDSNLNLNYKKINNLKNSCFVVIGKSGKTIETIINLGAVFSNNLLKNRRFHVYDWSLFYISIFHAV